MKAAVVRQHSQRAPLSDHLCTEVQLPNASALVVIPDHHLHIHLRGFRDDHFAGKG